MITQFPNTSNFKELWKENSKPILVHFTYNSQRKLIVKYFQKKKNFLCDFSLLPDFRWILTSAGSIDNLTSCSSPARHRKYFKIFDGRAFSVPLFYAPREVLPFSLVYPRSFSVSTISQRPLCSPFAFMEDLDLVHRIFKMSPVGITCFHEILLPIWRAHLNMYACWRMQLRECADTHFIRNSGYSCFLNETARFRILVIDINFNIRLIKIEPLLASSTEKRRNENFYKYTGTQVLEL